MAQEQALNARTGRNAALIEAMLLAAIADGKITQLEMETLLRQALARPEFEGTRPEELNRLIEESARKLAAASNLKEILQSLRERLPTHRARQLAFGLAATVAFAHQRATPSELGFLKTFQAALGISEAEVVSIIDAIERGESLAETLAEPLERLYAEVMVLVSAADGKVKGAETEALVESFAADPLFHNVSPEKAQAFVSESIAALASEGLGRRLEVLAHGLTSHAQRVKAFRLATRIAQASGRASANEAHVLELLQAVFGLADDEVERISREA